MVNQSGFMLGNSSSNNFYHQSNKVKNLMLSNHFPFKMLYTAFKQIPEGIWEEKYKCCRTSRSQSTAPSDGGMQAGAARQETSVLCIALFMTH